MKIKLVCTALALGLLSGCAFAKGGTLPEDAPQPSGQGGEESVCTAMYVPFGESGYIMVDQEDGAPFTIHVPEDIFGLEGESIAFEDLRAGNLVEITGDGAMAMSYPGQYFGVTKLRVVSEGKPEDINRYKEIVDSIYTEPDPSEPPSLNVEYRTPQVACSAVASRGSYQWSWPAEQEGQMCSAIACGSHVLQWKDMNDLALEGPTDLTLHFYGGEELLQVEVRRWPASFLGAENLSDEWEGSEEIELLEQNGNYVIPSADGEYVYQVVAKWERGDAEFGFMTR